MNIEQRLRAALGEAGATVTAEDLRPAAPPGRPAARRVSPLLLAAAAAVLLAGVAGVTMLRDIPEPRPVVLAGMLMGTASYAPGGAEVRVFVCENESPYRSCDGEGATPEEVEALEAALRALPQVREVAYQSKEEAYAQFRAVYSGEPDLADAVRVSDMPRSFNVWMRPGVDWGTAMRSAMSAPGVAVVSDLVCLDETPPPQKSAECLLGDR
ncbi:permease-like cell division protein FtsX [Spongiactinospora sp. TRM90649]|uniref:permease-like cell division protein FtsX n=1 Tax=Spongiactinospora sp. TRM90649 TaxID=3031114 RepID=UPI0023F64595|nr:permease-like cell division protein FtsX [Spongiactinospora sp. TRM90649]MDF5755938.1 permease-like cell division protein FtsX [Spongiactinospora sp. TRM90649]